MLRFTTMRTLILPLSLVALAPLTTGLLAGCSAKTSDDGSNTNPFGAAGTGGSGGSTASAGSAGTSNGVAGGGAAGAAQAGSGGGGSGGAAAGAGGAAAGAGGAAGAAGASGAGGAAGAAGAGGAGGLPAGCEELGSVGSTGRQCDPGMEGNGTFDQDQPPGDTPPEAEGDAPGMLTDTETHQSDVYGYGFNYQIYVPSQYVAGKPAALMIFQDHGNYLDTFSTPEVFETLITAGEMPVTIAVFISPGQDRSGEYDSINTDYADMLIDELIPTAVAANYDIVDDPNGWGIGGHSSGGAAAFTAGWNYPDKFRKILTNNGSFIALQDPGADTYRDLILTETPKPLRITMLSGTDDLVCCGDTWFNANNETAASLDTAGYMYRYMKGTGTHDPRPWGTYDYPDALRWLWRGYTLPHYDTP